MNDIDDVDTDDNKKSYGLTYSLDGMFFRRSCPSCGLDFKTLSDPDQISHLLTPEIQRLHDEALGNQSIEREGATKPLTCPYCGNKCQQNETLTRELHDYLIRWANREIVFPAIKEFQNTLQKSFGGKRSSGGFLSISMEVKSGSLYAPIRPISGPEIPDMRQIELLCCSSQVKILDNWESTLICPECGQEVIIL